jgi:hypothetical protein
MKLARTDTETICITFVLAIALSVALYARLKHVD